MRRRRLSPSSLVLFLASRSPIVRYVSLVLLSKRSLVLPFRLRSPRLDPYHPGPQRGALGTHRRGAFDAIHGGGGNPGHRSVDQSKHATSFEGDPAGVTDQQMARARHAPVRRSVVLRAIRPTIRRPVPMFPHTRRPFELCPKRTIEDFRFLVAIQNGKQKRV